VVHGQQQPVLAVAQPQQTCPQQRSPREIEACTAFRLRDPPRLRVALRLRQRAQVIDVERDVERRCDHLHQPRVIHREARAQRLVAANDLVQCPPQRVAVERSAETKGLRLVVDRLIGIQPVEQPQALLGERRRRRSRGVVPVLTLEIHSANDPVMRELPAQAFGPGSRDRDRRPPALPEGRCPAPATGSVPVGRRVFDVTHVARSATPGARSGTDEAR